MSDDPTSQAWLGGGLVGLRYVVQRERRSDPEAERPALDETGELGLLHGVVVHVHRGHGDVALGRRLARVRDRDERAAVAHGGQRGRADLGGVDQAVGAIGEQRAHGARRRPSPVTKSVAPLARTSDSSSGRATAMTPRPRAAASATT